jgi:hypothetical protein
MYNTFWESAIVTVYSVPLLALVVVFVLDQWGC